MLGVVNILLSCPPRLHLLSTIHQACIWSIHLINVDHVNKGASFEPVAHHL